MWAFRTTMGIYRDVVTDEMEQAHEKLLRSRIQGIPLGIADRIPRSLSQTKEWLLR